MNPKRTFAIPGAEAALDFPSHADVQRHLATARQLRAEATAAILRSAFRAAAPPLSPALAWLAPWRRQRVTREALMRCSDRVLADIGIERRHIPLIAKGIDPARHETRADALRRWAATARARLDAARAAQRDRRRIYRELMAYNDGELDDLGVRRTDIAGIARGEPHLGRAA